jgi:hypothetical protein
MLLEWGSELNRVEDLLEFLIEPAARAEAVT